MVDSAGSIVGRCMVFDVSATGAKLKVQEPADVPDNFELLLSVNGSVKRQCKVVWRADKSIGVNFKLPPPKDSGPKRPLRF